MHNAAGNIGSARGQKGDHIGDFFRPPHALKRDAFQNPVPDVHGKSGCHVRIDEAIATIQGARVGVFRGIAYPDYPRRSRNAVGGIMKG